MNMKKLLILMVPFFLVSMFYSSAVVAKNGGDGCNQVLKKEMKLWQSKTKFFQIKGNGAGKGVRDRADAMLVLKETLEDMAIEQCSDALLGEIEALKLQLNNYFVAEEEMRKIKDIAENSDADKKQEMLNKFRHYYTERGLAYGLFVKNLVNVFDSLNVKKKFG
jgi:hypothetical protein